MAVQTFNPTDLSQSATNWAVAQRIVGSFAPHEAAMPNLTVALDPGHLLNGTVLVEVPAQLVGPFAPPASGFRIDRVVIDRATGVASIVTGTANSLTPPGIPSGKLPVARVLLQPTTDVISNALIVDERVLADASAVAIPQVACRANRTADQTGIVNGSLQKVLFTDTAFNVGGAFDTASSQFKPAVAGYYSVFLQCSFTLAAGNAQLNAAIYKNGAVVSRAEFGPGANSMQAVSVLDIIYLNGTTDYLEFYTAQASGGTLSLMGGNTYTYMAASKVA